MELQTTQTDPSYEPPAGVSDSQPLPPQAEPPSSATVRRPYLKLVCAGFSFFYAGTNDGTIGPLLPYILKRYAVGTGLVTTIYVASFTGWLFSALAGTHMTTYLRLSLGAILFLGAGFQLLAQLLRFWGPPFVVFALTFFFASLGQAYQDAYSNTFVATIPGAHRWLGFIHAMYMLGCLTGPFIATPIASNRKWHYTYAVGAGLGVVNIAFVYGAFGQDIFANRKQQREHSRDLETRDRPIPEPGSESQSSNMQAIDKIKQTLKSRAVWLISLFFFFFLGAAITAGGWVVEYLVRVRNGDLRTMGYVSTGYYGGGCLGRLLLAEPTHRYGERRMIFIYALLCVALQIMFWRIPNTIGDAVLFSILGFFSGPFFPSGMSVATRLCPKSIQSTALGFIFVLAQAGGSLFPVLTGVIAAHAGVQVLQPILVGLFVLVCASWWLVPAVEKERAA